MHIYMLTEPSIVYYWSQWSKLSKPQQTFRNTESGVCHQFFSLAILIKRIIHMPEYLWSHRPPRYMQRYLLFFFFFTDALLIYLVYYTARTVTRCNCCKLNNFPQGINKVPIYLYIYPSSIYSNLISSPSFPYFFMS